MNFSYFIVFIYLFLLLFIFQQENQNEKKMMQIVKKKKGGLGNMLELAQKFIGKECVIYTFSGTQIVGQIKEVSNGAMLIENKGTEEAVNLEFVMRIREYPRNKNGKKKSIIID